MIRQAIHAALKPRSEDLQATRLAVRDFLVLLLFLAPVCIPLSLSFAFHDQLLTLVERRPSSGAFALIFSALILWGQMRIARHRLCLNCFNGLRLRGREVIDYLLLNRFGVLLLAVMSLTFISVPQGIETLRTLFEHRGYDIWYVIRISFFWFSLGLFAISLWYSGRVLVDAIMPMKGSTKGAAHLVNSNNIFKLDNGEEHASPIRTNIPRLLGAGAPLLMAIALHQASYAYLPQAPDWVPWLFTGPVLLVLLAGPRLMPLTVLVLFFLYTGAYLMGGYGFNMHLVSPTAWHALNRSAIGALFLAWVLASFFSTRRELLKGVEAARCASPEDRYSDPAQWRVIRFFGWALKPENYVFSGALFFSILTLVTLFPNFSATLGSTGLFLFAAGTFTRVGSALTYLSAVRAFPVFTCLIVALVVFGLVNDNHPIRTLHGGRPQAVTRYPNVEAYVSAWLDDALDRCPEALSTSRDWTTPDPEPIVPMFLVAAEGGGIRAAYWTASVLARLQDRNPCFASRTLALSGVSGGALGSAVFAAQVAQRLTDSLGASQRISEKIVEPNQNIAQAQMTSVDPVIDKTQPNQCRDWDWVMRPSRLACLRAILGQDFLSPALGYMLYPDLLQRFLPLPVAFFDRAGALEKAWEKSWRTSMNSNLMAAPFDTLWSMTHSPHDVPALFLNGTWVENGWRLIASPIGVSPNEMAAARNINDLSDAPMRLSTAAHLSARFTYVSPAGTLHRDGKIAGHVVDGGYFENSGAATLGEILLATRGVLEPKSYRWVDSKLRSFKVLPIVCIIRFQGQKPKGSIDFGGVNAPKPLLALKETTAPFATLLNTRSARGDYSIDAITAQIDRMNHQPFPGGKARVLTFNLRDGQGPLPLGWSLSSAAKEELSRQLEDLMEDPSVKMVEEVLGGHTSL